MKLLTSLRQTFSRRKPMIVLLPMDEPTETWGLALDREEMEEAFRVLNKAPLNASRELVLTVPPELQHLNLDQWMLLAETLQHLALEKAYSPIH